MSILSHKILGEITLLQGCILFISIFLSWIIGRILFSILSKISDKATAKNKPIFAVALKAFSKPLLLLSIILGTTIGFSFLSVSDSVSSIVFICIKIATTCGITWLLWSLVDVPDHILTNSAGKTASKLDAMVAPVVRKSLRLTIVVLGTVQIAQILSGKEISAIIAGLGIGGLAVALAAQDTIKNFFGSLVILFDKPFELGERINVDGHDGVIEEVGMRSTRLRRLDGHLVTLPNGELANKSIWNIAKRPFIRNLFNIGLTYDTPPNKIQEAKSIIEGIFENHEGMDEEFPPRVYFNKFGAHSLDLLVIIWYHPPAYWDYMAFVERTNLEILEKFNEAGIKFAFPTQTLHLAKDSEDPFKMDVSLNQ